jgi:hypothetical protein
MYCIHIGVSLTVKLRLNFCMQVVISKTTEKKGFKTTYTCSLWLSNRVGTNLITLFTELYPVSYITVRHWE